MKGWICLHRKLLDCFLWEGGEPFDYRSAWIDLLLLANHKDKDILFDGQKTTITRGQYLTSVRKLSERWGWSKDKTLKYLKLLESADMIRRDSNAKRTLITIVNYGVYQDVQDTDKDTERTLNGHSTDTDSYTDSPQTTMINNELNNVNNDNNDNNVNNKRRTVYYPEDEVLDKAFKDYLSMRKAIKKPMTDRAIELSMSKLSKLSGNDNDLAVAILEQSVMNSWQGLFPLKQDKVEEPISIVDKWERAAQELERRRNEFI